MMYISIMCEPVSAQLTHKTLVDATVILNS